jgi:hypothetical protein
MGNHKHVLPKPTATANAQTTPEIIKTDLSTKILDAPTSAAVQVNPDSSSESGIGAVKNDSNAIKTTPLADSASTEIKTLNSSADKTTDEKTEVIAERSKMDIATEIYKRMKKTKGVTRKEILELFMSEANLSKAGASTYFQLIKAKIK